MAARALSSGSLAEGIARYKELLDRSPEDPRWLRLAFVRT